MKSRASRFVRNLKDRLKRGCARAAQSILGSRSYHICGVPRGLVSFQSSIQEIYPVESAIGPVPRTIHPKLFWRFQEALNGISLPSEGILTIPNAMATKLGGNLTRDGKLITTFLQPIDGKPPLKHDLFRFSLKRFFPKVLHTQEPVATLAAGWQGAFYHWIYDVLPRLHLLEKSGASFNKIYVEASTPFQKESLALLGLGAERLINAKDYEAVFTPQLVVPSIAETPRTWGCQYLRDRFLPLLSKRKPMRLYVSRNDAERRRILNEEEALPLLKKYGYQKVELSALTFKEQMELFYSAERVVGPHGAGFSHLAFCQPGTPFLEIFSPAYVNICYWHVSCRVGLPYFYLFGKGEAYPDGFDPHIDPDIEVDLDQLEASLKLMESSDCSRR